MLSLLQLLFNLWALKSGAIKNLIGVRFFNVFGPNEYHKGEMASVIYKSHQQILKQGNIEPSSHTKSTPMVNKRETLFM